MGELLQKNMYTVFITSDSPGIIVS